MVELMLQTRVPAPRLLDWVDQAILHLHANIGGQTDGRPDPLLPTKEQEAFLQLLSGSSASGKIPRLRIVLDAIKDEEWVENLRCWHKTQSVQEEVVDVPAPAPGPRLEPRESTARAARTGASGRWLDDGTGASTVA
ncbi:MAG TPA: hypothetical protein VFZ09_00665 [Archangium sp.]|uniref:hypothetical protein n=1 Tax=Archangium sp. TaxID=1872627 RepID=UPI002E356BAD|nr:hypothetical protein [Archangium sp.]HEX5744718.1 hypothetical protein [Archangium sp.]